MEQADSYSEGAAQGFILNIAIFFCYFSEDL